MKPCIFICILILSSFSAFAEEVMLFADDHYKAMGEPEIDVSPVSPVLEAGQSSTICLALANDGLMVELIPLHQSRDAAIERKEELQNTDALSLTASLQGSGPISISSGPCKIAALPSGSVALAEFNVTSAEEAGGIYDLPLDLSYEHQIDARAKNGSISRLYLPVRLQKTVAIMVRSDEKQIGVEGISSDLYPGGNRTLFVGIKNFNSAKALNCSAGLLAAPPFRSTGEQYFLGSLGPGQIKVARLYASVDEDAALKEFKLACRIGCNNDDNDTLTVPLSITLEGKTNTFNGYFTGNVQLAAMALMFLGICGSVATAAARHMKRARPLKKRKRWL